MLFSLMTNLLSAEAIVKIDKNRELRINTDSNSLIITVDFIVGGKITDKYKIETYGPDRKIESLYLKKMKNKDYIFIEVSYGTPGGFQEIDKKDLMIFEIVKQKIVLRHDIELKLIVYRTKKKEYSSTKNLWYFLDDKTSEILLYEERDNDLKEIGRLQL